MLELKQGDRVKHTFLEGPLMYVEEVQGQIITCHWFDVNMAYHKIDFNISELKLPEKS